MPKPSRTSVSPAGLQQTSETWQMLIRRLSINVTQDDGSPIQPFLCLLANSEDSMVLSIEVMPEAPSLDAVRQMIFQAMLNPQKELRVKPRRPARIVFEQPEMRAAMTADLQNINVATEVGQADPDVERFIEAIEETLSSPTGGAEPVGLLSVEGVTPRQVSDLYNAAGVYWRAAPWQALDNSQTLKVRFNPPGKEGFVQLMGQGEMEFGLVLYWSWEDVLLVLTPSDDPTQHIPAAGLHVLSFESRNTLPTEDQEAIQKYGWKPVGQKRYLMPMIVHPDGYERPDQQELIFFEALLRAIPVFVEGYLKPDGDSDYEEVEATVTVRTNAGPLELIFTYPAGDLSEIFAWLDDDEGSEIEIPISPALEKANRLVEKAREQEDKARRIKLAHQALKTSEDCTDACILLAMEEASTPEEALAWFERGVEAGERVLGNDFFDEFEGEFWRAPAAHPYLRARQGMADMLVELDRDEEAIEHYQELVNLNWEDHAGARYPLLSLLLKLERDDEAQVLLDEFEGDEYAAWPYSRALLLFRQEGDSSAARLELKAALTHNTFVPPYITGAKPMPATPPEFGGFGDESEAVHYSVEHYSFWWSTPGAVDWLKAHS